MSTSRVIDPSWARSVVIVRRLDEYTRTGSGVFLSPTSVITAAHVVFSQETPFPSAAALEVEAPRLARKFTVHAVAVHPRWQDSATLDADYALLDVAPALGLGLPVRWDYRTSAGTVQLSRYGYPTNESARYAVGDVRRVGNMFYSNNLTVPEGASGGALVEAVRGRVMLVGITTFSGDGGPGRASFIGLPLLPSVRDTMQPAGGASS